MAKILPSSSAPAPASPAVAAPAPAARAAAAVSGPVPSASTVAAASKITSGEKPTHEVTPQAQRAAREAFFKVQAPDGEKQQPSTADKGASAPVESGQATAATASDAAPAVTTEEVDGLVYEAPGTAAPAGDSAGESTFTLPEWTSKITDPESRAAAEKFARNEWEQTQKLKRQRGEAQAESAKGKQEREALEKQLQEYQQAATPVAAPELVLPAIRTEGELEAFVVSAPQRTQELSGLLNDIQHVLDGLKESDEFTAFGRTFNQSDLGAIEQQQLETWQSFQQHRRDLENIPAKRDWLTKRREVLSKLPKGYDKQFTTGSAEYAARLALLDPKQGGAASLDAHPKAPVLIGDHLTMEMVRAGKLKLVKASAPSVTAPAAKDTPPPAGSRDSTAPVPRSEQQSDDDLRERARTGDVKAQQELRRQFFRVEREAA